MRKGPDGTYLPAKAEDIYTGRVAGRITVMRVLRGRPTAKYIEFSTSECAGLRLDVGHYFFVATSEVGPLLRLGAGDRSVIDLRSEYHEANPREYNDRQPFLSTILQFLHGKPLPKKFPSIEMIQYTQSGAMPPLLPDEER
jgi:hypothetical protein